MTDFPQDAILDWCCNIFASDMDSEIECTFSKSADNTKLSAAVNMLKEKNAIEKDLDSLERWVCANFMKLNKSGERSYNWIQAMPKTNVG